MKRKAKLVDLYSVSRLLFLSVRFCSIVWWLITYISKSNVNHAGNNNSRVLSQRSIHERRHDYIHTRVLLRAREWIHWTEKWKKLHELRADSIIKVKVGRAAWVNLIFVECRSSKKSSAVTIQEFCTRLDKAMNMNFPRAQQESNEMDDRNCVEVDWTLLDVLRLITNEKDVAMPLFSLNLFTCNCFDSWWIHPKSRELSF